MSKLPLFNQIFFWEPCVSPHKLYFLSSVANILGCTKIICIADQDLPDDRKKLGWSSNIPNNVTVFVNPSKQFIDELFNNDIADTFHVFSGIRHLDSIIYALKIAQKTHALFSIMSEPRVLEGWQGKLRYFQSLLTEYSLRNQVSCVLAIGRNGPLWFQSVGYDREKIFPFAYFVPPPHSLDNANKKNNGKIRIGYLGRLVKEKGIFDIVSAFNLLGNNFELVIAGQGKDEVALTQEISKHNISARIMGVIPNDSIHLFFKEIDILILASTTSDDGWGVVVSEALMHGIPAIATYCVGASIVLEDPLLGRVVQPHNPKDIKKAVQSIIEQNSFTEENKSTRKKIAISRLSDIAGAKYFIKIIEHVFLKKSRPINFYQKDNL